MMKRNWLVGLMMAGMLALAGCGGQGTTSSTTPATTETITVSAAASMQGAMEELKADYVKKHNLKPEQIMAFGDSENDIEMLELAGISYAMENAEEAVKEIATKVAPANSQAGVYQVLENWLERGE